MYTVREAMKNQKIDRIKELLSVPCEERTEKMCLELMSFTKVRKKSKILS
ncbi:MAG: hypothetical protein MJ252_15180 [archaeon]|nr:hypothetical protein [archaeon]